MAMNFNYSVNAIINAKTAKRRSPTEHHLPIGELKSLDYWAYATYTRHVLGPDQDETPH